MPRGGARAGAGRKSIAAEEQTREKAKAAIQAKYETLEKGLESLLNSGEPSLVKFVFEHAFGKPTEDVDITSNGKSISAKEIIYRDYTRKTPTGV